MESEHRVLRSRPRSFYLPSTESSQPGTPIVDESSPPPDSLDPKQDDLTSSRSMMNLTSPTLYGIYSPTAFGGVRDESGTPWDTGAQTPNLQHSPPVAGRDYFSPAGKGISEQTVLQAHVVKKHGFRGYVLPLIRRSVLLFLFGMAYGGIITHLHGHPNVAGRVPVNMEHIDLDQRSLGYLALWGVAGVALGSLQPWFDLLWGDDLIVGRSQNAARTAKGNGLLEWSPMVRSIGAFVGIAFAIPFIAAQEQLPTAIISVASSVIILFQYLAGSLSISTAQSIIQNRLPTALEKYAPDTDIRAIVRAGATEFIKTVPPDQLLPIKIAYNEALVKIFYIPAASAAAAIFASIAFSWRKLGTEDAKGSESSRA
ncbi:hypothetical protein DIZ76_015609 [Coccidioides immitis]|nr:hypothetical protein DIZ76_015609 [Coccidioides immitis]